MGTVCTIYNIKKVEGFADFADYYAIIDTSIDDYKYILQVIDDTTNENTWLVRGFLNVNDDLMYWGDYWYKKNEHEDFDNMLLITAAKIDISTEALTSEIYNLKLENNL